MRYFLSAFLLVLLISPCNADDASEAPAQRYIDEALSAWELKYEECKVLESSRDLPGQDILHTLKRYDDQRLREYLVSQSYQALEQCTQAEAGELSYAVLALINSEEVTEDIKEEATKLGEMLHIKTWSMRQVSYDLPEEMRKELSKISYFDEPFRSFELLKVLDAH